MDLIKNTKSANILEQLLRNQAAILANLKTVNDNVKICLNNQNVMAEALDDISTKMKIVFEASKVVSNQASNYPQTRSESMMDILSDEDALNAINQKLLSTVVTNVYPIGTSDRETNKQNSDRKYMIMNIM